jgi:hypothetical protein
MNAYVGISKTLAAYPYPWNIALAALHAVAAFAQVQQIRSASFGSSTSPGSIGGGGAVPVFPAAGAPATPVAPIALPQAAAARTNVNITLIGTRETPITYGQMVDEFIPLLKEAGANGAIDLNVTFA